MSLAVAELDAIAGAGDAGRRAAVVAGHYRGAAERIVGDAAAAQRTLLSALRRAGMQSADGADEAPLAIHELRIDPAKRAVQVRGEAVELTFVEFEILNALARSPGRVFTRELLLTRVWGDSAYRDPRAIDVHIRHLREKLEERPEDPSLILTVRGAGYRFRER